MRPSKSLALAAAGILALGAAAVTATATLAQTPAAAPNAALEQLRASPAGAYEIEPSHTSVVWKLNYNGIVTYQARFEKVSGTLNLNPANPVDSSVDITIDPKSVSTGLPAFNEKIAKDVFKADANPSIRFVSRSLASTGPTTGTMTGEMTLAGVTRPVTWQVRFNGARNNPFAGMRRNPGFTATTTFSRADFGSTQWAPGVGDAVTVEVEAAFIKSN